MREALCERLRTAGCVGATPDDVIVTAGANQAFMLALMTLLDAGDEVLLPAPYFTNHEMALRALGIVPVEVPVGEATAFRLRWADLAPFVSPRTRAVILCTPSNPTGAIVPAGEMTRIAGELAARGASLIVDETYARFVYEGAFQSAAMLPDWRETVVVVSTFSKSFGMTGWRVGYMLADARVCEQAIKIQDAMIICAPVVSQMAVEAAIREHWDYAVGFARALRARRQMLAHRLMHVGRLHWTPPDGGFFAFVRVDGCADSAALAAEILQRVHVVTIPGSTFGRCAEGYLRLSYGAVDEAALAEACDRLHRFLTGR